MSRRSQGLRDQEHDDHDHEEDAGQWEKVNGMWEKPTPREPEPIVKVPRLRPLTDGQAEAIRVMDANRIVWLNGPAGCGKTHLAVGKAVDRLEAGESKRLVFLRPAIEVGGEHSGFLPGDETMKVAPYLRPLLDELNHFYDYKHIRKMIEERTLELGAVGFLRGRTYLDSDVILDESQNATYPQLRVFLNRLGAGSRMTITGDLSVDDNDVMKQCDLHPADRGAMAEFSVQFSVIHGIARVDLQVVDVVRDPLVRAMQEHGL